MLYSLSICIPTFNRALYLSQTLSNILKIVPSNIEVIIYDGNSLDDTEEVLAKWARKYKNLTYVIADENGGVDLDYQRVINLASSDYCWLMSSDDFISEDSITEISKSLKEYSPSVILFDRFNCDKLMTVKSRENWLLADTGTQCFKFRNNENWIEYFEKVQSLGGLFSYISSIVIKRSDWLNIGNENTFLGTNYNHVPRILNMLKKGGTLLYLHKALVYCREDNDSFSSDGLVGRYMIDFKGYHMIGSEVFANDKELKEAFYKVIRFDHHFFRLVKIRANCKTLDEWKIFKKYLFEMGYSKNVINLSEHIGRYTTFMKFLFRVRTGLKKIVYR